ncbi:type II secretion system protein GspH [Vibrio sp. HA2012]|uniref:type II secretion system minor pseudopilin GspH n=1 Tax=Vibrio sp. HA2012 TaxID=1971595 RepID=UPI000C2CB8FA|nr:type II secretion system minor pseudopilin GspH [Vibrio sp. HA2012]PJC85080.1 type II secretion system protein GspH [Vibrio sp. HA2012]
MNRQTGFTLIEVMLVVTLLALTTATVVFNLPDSRQDMAQEQARRLYHKLQLLNEDAILNGQDYGIRLEEKHLSYHVLVLKVSGWQEYHSRFYVETQLEDSLQWVFTPGGGIWEHNDGLFKPESLFDDDMFADPEQKEKRQPPQILVLSSGEVTPFRLTIFPQGEKQTQGWQVVASESGEILLLAPGETDKSATGRKGRQK